MTNKDKIEILESANEHLAKTILRDDLPENTRNYFVELIQQNKKEIEKYMRTFTLHEDSGHAWLEVPISEIVKLGLTNKITKYSYKDENKQLAYLEEDQDLFVFHKAYKSYYGENLDIQRILYDGNCFIRNLKGF